VLAAKLAAMKVQVADLQEQLASLAGTLRDIDRRIDLAYRRAVN
jgi:hypothetical protein